MSREEIFRCDVCKKPRGESNHWFIIRDYKANDSTRPMLGIFRWDHNLASETVIHLCGEACVLKKVSEFLSAK